MNNTDEAIQLENIFYIGLLVGTFRLNTNRVLKSIALCKECLVLLNGTEALITDKEYCNVVLISIYTRICKGYDLISDHTSAIEYGKKF